MAERFSYFGRAYTYQCQCPSMETDGASAPVWRPISNKITVNQITITIINSHQARMVKDPVQADLPRLGCS